MQFHAELEALVSAKKEEKRAGDRLQIEEADQAGPDRIRSSPTEPPTNDSTAEKAPPAPRADETPIAEMRREQLLPLLDEADARRRALAVEALAPLATPDDGAALERLARSDKTYKACIPPAMAGLVRVDEGRALTLFRKHGENFFWRVDAIKGIATLGEDAIPFAQKLLAEDGQTLYQSGCDLLKKIGDPKPLPEIRSLQGAAERAGDRRKAFRLKSLIRHLEK